MDSLWQKIKHGSQAVGDFQARLLLAILYFVLLLPTGIIMKIGGDPLESRYPARRTTFWKLRNSNEPSLRPAHRQG